MKPLFLEFRIIPDLVTSLTFYTTFYHRSDWMTRGETGKRVGNDCAWRGERCQLMLNKREAGWPWVISGLFAQGVGWQVSKIFGIVFPKSGFPALADGDSCMGNVSHTRARCLRDASHCKPFTEPLQCSWVNLTLKERRKEVHCLERTL